MSFNARNAGSDFILGEGVCSSRERPPCHRGWRLGGEKFFVDSDYTGLRRSARVSIKWAVPSGRGKAGTAFRRVAFSSHRKALATIKEANYCWWESCSSFCRLSCCTRRWFMDSSDSDGRSPTDWNGSL